MSSLSTDCSVPFLYFIDRLSVPRNMGRRPHVSLFSTMLWLWLCSPSSAWFASSPILTRREAPVGRFRLSGALPENYQKVGNDLIYEAAALCGVSRDQINIEWKGGRVVVQVRGDDVYVSDLLEEDDDEEEEFEDDPALHRGVDIIVLSRAINAALDDGGVGLAIAESHEIEVTTPGASDELSGIMFESYKGFDVIAQHQDPKKKTVQTIEGKLVERNVEFTILNIKGRMKKLKNQDVISVKLPKAKKEKGSL